jgi:hypothetical protein
MLHLSNCFITIYKFYLHLCNKKIHIKIDYCSKDKEECKEFIIVKKQAIDDLLENSLLAKLINEDNLKEIQLY